MLLQILATLFYFAFFNYLIYRFKPLQIKPFKYVVTGALFNLKFLTGIFIWMVYTFYYRDIPNNDIHKFYSDAVILHQNAYENPRAFLNLMAGKATDSASTAVAQQMKNWNRNFDEAPFNENRTIIRLNALIMFFSFKTYFVHILFMCFISLAGWVLLINAVFRNSQPHQIFIGLIVMLLPSVLFWTSGVTKEPLLILGLGLFMQGLLYPLNASRIIYMALGFTIILMSKFFILAALVPAAIAFTWNARTFKKSAIVIKYIVVYSLLLIAAFNIHYFLPRINPTQMLVNKQEHSVKEAIYFKAGSQIEIPAITANATSIITTAPAGIWNTLLRPYLWEGKNIMMLASALENLAVLLLITYCLFNTDFKNRQSLNTVFMLFSFSMAYFALIGICTPVLGNLVRYRAPALPFFLFAWILNVKENDITKKLTAIFS